MRYEAAFHFETQFRLSIEQKGLIKLDRVYGKRSNPKIMAFGTRHPVPEMKRGWGSTENIFWEGHDACVQLEPGPVTLMLVADKQPSPAAKRNVDLVMLTQDEAEIQRRIREENHAPLDGLLTQAGDVYLKFHNELDSTRTKLAIPIGVEHSPYWVHLRTWQPKSVELKAGESSNWIEVGSLLDSLNDGQWRLSTRREDKLHYRVEIGVKNASDEIDSIATLESREPVLELAYDANTRYSRRIRHYREPLADLVAYLRERPVIGPMPKQTLVYATTFPPHPHDEIYSALRIHRHDGHQRARLIAIRQPRRTGRLYRCALGQGRPSHREVEERRPR